MGETPGHAPSEVALIPTEAEYGTASIGDRVIEAVGLKNASPRVKVLAWMGILLVGGTTAYSLGASALAAMGQ